MNSGSKDQPSTPLDRLLDLGVYAPLGLALEFQRLFPELAEAGRKQVNFSRSLGKAALGTVMASRNSGARTASAKNSSPSEKASEAQAKSPKTDKRASSKSTVGIDGYGGLTAKDVIAIVRVSDEDTLAWIVRTESAAKSRVTVLRAVDRRRVELG